MIAHPPKPIEGARRMLTLQDSLIRLTPLTIDHFDAMLRIAEECPETWQYTPNNAHGADNMHRYIQSALVNRAAGKHLPFAIEHRPDSRIIGSTRFYHIDKHHQTVNIGYTWLHSDFRGRSINKRAKFLLLQHAFEHWNMQRIGFTADINNTASIRAMLSIGCTLEGILRSDIMLSSGQRRNTAVFSILQQEWYGHVKAMLAQKIR